MVFTTQSRYRSTAVLDEQHIQQLHALYQLEWWTRGRTIEDVRQMLGHTDMLFGICDQAADRLVAFARVLTDRVYKAFIFDVIVAADHRQAGLGRRLLDEIVGHPDLAPVRHLELYCLPELVPLYEKWGFSAELGGVTLMRRTMGS